ncbi:MAG: thiamine phosphate synthase [bacterium]|nr:thiamine phosphate synthase [bacterium]
MSAHDMSAADLPLPRLHVITDNHTTAAAVLAAGAPAIQVRIKNQSDAAVLAECQKIMTHGAVAAPDDDDVGAADGATTPRVIVNDRADIAMACGAHGVHLGAEDLPIAAVRKLVSTNYIVGATARDPNTARYLQDNGATYLGVGPIYPTTSKANLPEPIGLAGLEKVAAAVEVPVIAIAGITIAKIPEVLNAGAYGAAVLSAISSATNPTKATVEFIEAFNLWITDALMPDVWIPHAS